MEVARQLLLQTKAKFEASSVVSYYDHLVGDGLFPFEEYLIMKWVPCIRGCRVLDLGCGAGREALALARAGAYVIAVDLAPRMLDAARSNAEKAGVAVDFMLSDCLNLADIGQCDLVLATNNFLEHIPSRTLRRQVLRQMREVSSPEGFIILSAHNRELAVDKWGPFWERQDKLVAEATVIDGYQLELGDKFLDRVCASDTGETSMYQHIYRHTEMLEDLACSGLGLRCHRSVPDLLRELGQPMESQFSTDVVYYVCTR